MPHYYPVFLDLKGRLCVIVGGGVVAERKVQALLECQGRVTVISPSATEEIQQRASSGELEWLARRYEPGDLKGAFLAIAATDQRPVNVEIADEAAAERVILNVVDDAPLCVFIAPAVVKRGEVTVALSTGGASPALARKLKESLADGEALRYADLAGVLSAARKELKRLRVQVHPDRWQECITEDLLEMVTDGRSEQALKQLVSALQEGSSQEAIALT